MPKKSSSSATADRSAPRTPDLTSIGEGVYARQSRRVFRMYVLRPGAGERYYLRMMLSHLPAAPLNERDCSAHQDQRIQDAWKAYRSGPDGEHVDSFQQAAHAHGIAGGAAEAIQCFEELANSRHGDKGRMLRQLFVTHSASLAHKVTHSRAQ